MLRINARALIQFSMLWGGRLLEGVAYIIASITQEIQTIEIETFICVISC